MSESLFQRRHYKRLAHYLREAELLMPEQSRTTECRRAVCQFIQIFLIMMNKDNENFDFNKFIEELGTPFIIMK